MGVTICVTGGVGSGKSTVMDFIIEYPLVFEAADQNMFDKVIVVTAERSARIGRTLKRDIAKHRTPEQVEAIIERQIPEKLKVSLADYVV
jgi:dephospho-CoA kinase